MHSANCDTDMTFMMQACWNGSSIQLKASCNGVKRLSLTRSEIYSLSNRLPGYSFFI